MTKRLIVLCTLLASVLPCAAADEVDWVQRSNLLARPALEVLAKYNPETAARYGLDGYDDEILDLQEGVYERQRNDTLRVIERLKEQATTEKHRAVKQDLELLVQTLVDRRERQERHYRLMLPYICIAEVIFETTRSMLNDNVAETRHSQRRRAVEEVCGVVS